MREDLDAIAYLLPQKENPMFENFHILFMHNWLVSIALTVYIWVWVGFAIVS